MIEKLFETLHLLNANIPILAASWATALTILQLSLQEKEVVIRGHSPGYLYVWGMRCITAVLPFIVPSPPQVFPFEVTRILNYIANLGPLFLFQLAADAAGAVIMHLKSRHWLEHLFALNFIVVVPYIPVLLMALGSLTLRLRSKVEGEEDEESIYLGDIEYGIARIPALTQQYQDGATHTDRWAPVRARGKVCYRPSREVNPHLVLTGKSGSGKTSTLIRLAKEVTALGNISIIDFHGEYVGLSNLINGKVIDISKTGFNPFTSVADENMYRCALDLIASIKIIKTYKVGVTQEAELTDAVKYLSPKNTVTLEDVLKEVEQRLESESIAHGHVWDALFTLKERILLLQCGFRSKTGFQFKELVEGNTIVDLSGIPDENVKTICGELLLRKMQRYITKTGRRWNSAKRFIVVDEAHRIAQEEGVINMMMRESRKYGLACILATQLAKDLDDAVMSNAGLKLFLLTDNRDDIESIVNVTGCRDLLPEVLSNLAPLEAVVMHRQPIGGLKKTSLGKPHATTTLYVASLKPYFKDNQIKLSEPTKTKTREEAETPVLHADEEGESQPLTAAELKKIRVKLASEIPAFILYNMTVNDLNSLVNLHLATDGEVRRLERLGLAKGMRRTLFGMKVIKTLSRIQSAEFFLEKNVENSIVNGRHKSAQTHSMSKEKIKR